MEPGWRPIVCVRVAVEVWRSVILGALNGAAADGSTGQCLGRAPVGSRNPRFGKGAEIRFVALQDGGVRRIRILGAAPGHGRRGFAIRSES
jgi:hypothetical protein